MKGFDPITSGNSLLELEDLAMNQIWDNVQSIVGGGGVVSLGGVHGSLNDVTANPFDEWGWQPGGA